MTTEDTELAEAIANLRRGTEIRLAALEEGRVSVGTGRFLATIVRAVLARPGLLTDPAIALVGTRDGARSYMAMTDALGQIAEMVGLPADVDEDDAIVSGVRQALARPAAGRDLTDVEDGPTAVELLDDNERLGAALVDIGIAVGLPRPSATVRWGAPEILARIATLDSESGVPPRAEARIAQARTDQTEGYGSTTSTVEGLLRELDRRGGELVRLRAACARPAVARTDGQPDYATIKVRADVAGMEGWAWPVVARVPGGWQSGAHHYPDADVLDVRPLALAAAPADDTAAPDTVVVPRVHLRSWVDFLRALVQQDAIRALNARDAALDNARQIESWAGQPVRDSQPEAES